MRTKWLWTTLASVPLAIGGWVFAGSQAQSENRTTQDAKAGYVCPITGEELPCPKCCPLNARE